jgi:Protein of unknown function (DUF2892)
LQNNIIICFNFVEIKTTKEIAMKKNVGTIDRRLRALLTLVVFVLIYFKVLQGTTAWVGSVLAFVLIITSMLQFSPLYIPFRITTIKK